MHALLGRGRHRCVQQVHHQLPDRPGPARLVRCRRRPGAALHRGVGQRPHCRQVQCALGRDARQLWRRLDGAHQLHRRCGQLDRRLDVGRRHHGHFGGGCATRGSRRARGQHRGDHDGCQPGNCHVGCHEQPWNAACGEEHHALVPRPHLGSRPRCCGHHPHRRNPRHHPPHYLGRVRALAGALAHGRGPRAPQRQASALSKS
mmetsp:Transcript_32626/g.50641  ORF Transcript_32626/g.50641 Transcript_32626/m.50641 type:complete len:203 (-) Transcript_32626:46-654(-)